MLYGLLGLACGGRDGWTNLHHGKEEITKDANGRTEDHSRGREMSDRGSMRNRSVVKLSRYLSGRGGLLSLSTSTSKAFRIDLWDSDIS
jgi:hypothetical protein